MKSLFLVLALVFSPTADASDLSELAPKKVRIIDFWATWCDVCKVELEEMAKLLPAYGSLQLILVNLDADPQRGRDFLTTLKLPANTIKVFDPTLDVAKFYKLEAFPTTMLMDADGKIVLTLKGFEPGKDSVAELLAVAQALVKKP